ncbi:MAG: NADH-quinone oxidoreductase subunit K [Pseudomonadota bacterium]
MEPILAALAGLLAATGVFLMLSGHMLRLVFGIVLLGSSANLAVFTGGRLTEGAAPLIPTGSELPEAVVANPLPQALVLTAIVIGFGFAAFALALALAAHRRLGTVNPEEMRVAEADPPAQPAVLPASPPAPEKAPIAARQPAGGVTA